MAGKRNEKRDERLLQAQLDLHERGSVLDLSTPKDGHCLFHALRRAGLLTDCPDSLDIPQLRRLVCDSASPEQLTMAACSQNVSADEYVQRMCVGDHGDNLTLVLLATCFDRAITTIGLTYVRTWWPDGREADIPEPSALWVAHRPEKHYYGIVRAADGLAQEQESPSLIRPDVSSQGKLPLKRPRVDGCPQEPLPLKRRRFSKKTCAPGDVCDAQKYIEPAC